MSDMRILNKDEYSNIEITDEDENNYDRVEITPEEAAIIIDAVKEVWEIPEDKKITLDEAINYIENENRPKYLRIMGGYDKVFYRSSNIKEIYLEKKSENHYKIKKVVLTSSPYLWLESYN